MNFIWKSCRLCYNVVKYGGSRENAIWSLRVVYWTSKPNTCASTLPRPCIHTHLPTHPHARMHTDALTHPRVRTHPPTHTHKEICNICCFSTATMVSRTRLVVTLHVYCMSWLLLLLLLLIYKVVHIWPGLITACLHTISPGHIWTTLYNNVMSKSSSECPHYLWLRTKSRG